MRKVPDDTKNIIGRFFFLVRTGKIFVEGLKGGECGGKVMGGKRKNTFLRHENEVVVMEPAGSSSSLSPRLLDPMAAAVSALDRIRCV